MNITEIIDKCKKFIIKEDYTSFDLFDALTNPFVNFITKNKPFARRIANQINSKSPIDLHWTGMKKMVHTKTISDMLWYSAISGESDKIEYYYKRLLELKVKDGIGWGLNFPYTSRFIDADENMPNLYNTVNSGIAICYAYEYLSDEHKAGAKNILMGIMDFMNITIGYVDEGEKGWYLYYPGQKYPTYNVNALAVYFLAFVKKLYIADSSSLDIRIKALINLICDEQNADGSWYYSRSPKGKWIDGFHSGFVLESLSFVYKDDLTNKHLGEVIKKGWNYYIQEMILPDGYSKYFSYSKDKFPIEAQNCSQTIQTISLIGKWLGWNEKDLLRKIIKNVINDLYDSRGYFYYKKTKLFTYKTPYIRWSVTPMILALNYSREYLVEDNI